MLTGFEEWARYWERQAGQSREMASEIIWEMALEGAERLRKRAAQAGVGEEVVAAITAFVGDDGEVYIGVPDTSPVAQQAFDAEYGTLGTPATPFLRTTMNHEADEIALKGSEAFLERLKGPVGG